MATPIEQIIQDAKKLASRLKEKEALCDLLENDTTKCGFQLEVSKISKIPSTFNQILHFSCRA